MPGFLLHVNAQVRCTHQAVAVVPPPPTPKVFANGQPVVGVGASITVAGCPFQIPTPAGPKPQPCVTITWGTVATKVTVGGQFALLGPAPGVVPGICQSAEQIPQGPPTVNQMQMKVSGL